MRLGNGKWEHTSFNNSLQPTEIGLGSSATDSGLLKLGYEYGTTSNNGNVIKQVITVPTIGTATGFTATQNYQYDQLNRLTGAQEVNGTSSAWQSSGTLWQQKFGYDQYGNRAVDTGNTTSTLIGPNPLISTVTNRITPRSGEYYDYDYAGNMKKGQSGDTLAYDGENKLVQYQGGATQSGGADYFYDGDGRRVKKAQPSETLIFVYNIGGQLVAEYTTSTPGQNGTSYLTSDTLGTPRVIAKADGSIKARHDYLPFGEELYAGVGSRTGTPGQSYDQGPNPADKTRQKFTQKERDNETGLDYFSARYYASTQGRFTSVDPLAASAIPIHAQSWNRYSYSYNNPLRYTDPSGMVPGDFYNLDGKKIGTDGVNDGIKYVVYDKNEANQIEKTTGNYTGAVTGKVTIGSADVVTAIGDAVTRSNSASFTGVLKPTETATGGFTETGITGITANGSTQVTVAPNGPPADPRVAGAEISLPSNVDVKAHVHPSGEIVETTGSKSGGNVTIIGNTSTSTASFKQTPSPLDVTNALPNGTNIVVGAKDKTVYFYGSTGNKKDCNCIAKMSLSNFMKIK